MNNDSCPTAAAERKVSGGIAKIDAGLWPHLLWARDSFRGSCRVLLLGEGAGLTAVLLAREGVRAEALDANPEQLTATEAALQDDVPGIAELVRLNSLSGASLEAAIAAGTFDGIFVVPGSGLDLGDLLDKAVKIAADEAGVAVLVPFGSTAGSVAGFPRTVAEKLPDFSIAEMEYVDGMLRALLIRRREMPDREIGVGDLLRITEEGSAASLRSIESEVRRLRTQLSAQTARRRMLEQQVRELHESTSFQLGYALISALRSPKQALRLPSTLVSVIRSRSRRGGYACQPEVKSQAVLAASATGLNEWQKEALRNRVRAALDDGVLAIRDEVETFLADAAPPVLALGYMVAAQTCAQQKRHDLEFEIGTLALETHRSVGILRGYLHVCLRARQMESASNTLRELYALANSGNRIAIDFLRGFSTTSSYKIAALELIPPKPAEWRPSSGRRFAYVLHNSLPYSSGGYATRSQGVARGLVDIGYDVTCVTRPGFPIDVKPEMLPGDVPRGDVIDGVPYVRLIQPVRVGRSEYEYIKAAAEVMTQEISRLAPSFVQAGSNYVTGLPALIAARRLGVPFFYEVRGLWEITRLSRDEEFGRSISFDVQRHIESALAREADHVFTLTEPMREELIDRGVDPARITLLPNSVDAQKFQNKPRNDELAARLDIPPGMPVIGYVGTFVVYEGLEDLASACVELHRSGRDFRLLMVGNENASGQGRGSVTEEIVRIAEEGGILDKLIMPGRIPHDEVQKYYSLIDICPFPRKPWPVCEMVSPMKPLEALAMSKAVVVSSVRALTEMIDDGRTGRVFEKGSIASLSRALADLLDDPEMRRRLGAAGREWVKSERSWRQVAERIAGIASRFEFSVGAAVPSVVEMRKLD